MIFAHLWLSDYQIIWDGYYFVNKAGHAMIRYLNLAIIAGTTNFMSYVYVKTL